LSLIFFAKLFHADIRDYIFPEKYDIERIADNFKKKQNILEKEVKNNIQIAESNHALLEKELQLIQEKTNSLNEILEQQQKINNKIEENINLSEKMTINIMNLLDNETEQTEKIHGLTELISKYKIFFQYQFDEPTKTNTIDEIFNHYLTLDNNTLHYIAYHDSYGNVKDYAIPSLEKDLIEYGEDYRTKEEQLEKYYYFAKNYEENIKNIEIKLEELKQGKLIKIAFDVEIGGVFYYLYPDTEGKVEYIFGATLNQKTMDNASAYKQMQDIFVSIDNYIRKKNV